MRDLSSMNVTSMLGYLSRTLVMIVDVREDERPVKNIRDGQCAARSKIVSAPKAAVPTTPY